MELTYENIESLILEQTIEGSMIKLKFKANNQEIPMETVAVVTPDPEAMKKKIMKQAGKTAAVSAGVGAASSALGGMIGGIAGGLVSSGASMATSAASSGMMNTEDMMKPDMSDENVQKAIVQAFSYLQTYYKFENNIEEETFLDIIAINFTNKNDFDLSHFRDIWI